MILGFNLKDFCHLNLHYEQLNLILSMIYQIFPFKCIIFSFEINSQALINPRKKTYPCQKFTWNSHIPFFPDIM